MRDLSGTSLLAAQTTGVKKRKPYIYLLFTSYLDSTEYDYTFDPASTTNRLLKINHEEWLTSGRATITLRNDDRAVPNLEGYWTEIGYGDYTVAGGNEYKQTARLEVKSQVETSAPGILRVVLELEGTWEALDEQPFQISGTSPPLLQYTYTSTTPYNIITDLLDEISFTLAALAVDDGVMDTLQPSFSVNRAGYESLKGAILRCVDMTSEYLRASSGVEFEAIYPQVTDGIDETYYSDMAHWFYTYSFRRNLLIPNHFKVFGNRGTDGLWTSVVTGEDSDTDEINKYRDVTGLSTAALLTTEAAADTRASGLLLDAKTKIFAGRLTTPHDIRVQVLDRVQVIDSRGYV